MGESSGLQLRQLVQQKPLQIAGTINAYSALMAQKAGIKAIYLSGAGVANASLGMPDLAVANLHDVLEDARRITDACALPLLVDIDTGWGNPLTIARAVKLLEKAQVAAIHIEDQVLNKRCGHRPNKAIVSLETMGDRIKAAVDARVDANFVIMARTDAYAVEGMQAAIDRANYCIELGADMIFPEAMTTLEEYRQFANAVSVPILANITEFGKTPLFTIDELKDAKVGLILYPLSAFRAMSQIALEVYGAIHREGTQASMIKKMQTREELYDVLNYYQAEKMLDADRGDGYDN